VIVRVYYILKLKRYLVRLLYLLELIK